MSLKQRYDDINSRIDAAARRVGRQSKDIILVAVTKHASIEQIRELIDLGHVDLGESRVQQLIQRSAQIDEYLQRCRQLSSGRTSKVPSNIRWHMIGHLQRNKVRKLLDHVRLIHSVESLRLAEELQQFGARLDKPIEVLVQINSSGEKSKYGVAPAAARHLVEQIDTMMSLRPRGIMCMAPESEDPCVARDSFQFAQEIFEDIRHIGVGGEKFDILSMGMSNDFEVAIECGANVVRVGSGLFGESNVAGGSEAAAE